MKIAIVDDDELFMGKLEGFILGENRKKRHGFQVDTYYNGWDMVDSLDDMMADVYLLDIEIGDVNGLELARRIRERNEHVYIIFLTSHEKYAINGYEYQAYSYIIKEQWQQHLPGILEKIWELEKTRQERVYYIIAGRRYDRFYMDDIIYVEKNKKNTVFYCQNGLIYWERSAIADVYKRLPQKEFVYVNRSQIVNIRYITHLDIGEVTLDKNIRLEVSRQMMQHMREHILEYWRKE